MLGYGLALRNNILPIVFIDLGLLVGLFIFFYLFAIETERYYVKYLLYVQNEINKIQLTYFEVLVYRGTLYRHRESRSKTRKK